MADFIYKEPYLYKDKENKKWMVRYSIKYPGDAGFDPRKEYGRIYYNSSLNLIKILKQREAAFKDLIKAISIDLSNGIDKQKPEILKEKIEAEIKASRVNNFDELFKYYCDEKGYTDPVQKKELSSANIKRFFNNQLRPFLEKKNMVDDLSKVVKKDILEFMNFHHKSTDPKLKWNNNTFNNRKGWIHGFFQTLIDEDKLLGFENPTQTIKSKETLPTERFETFSRAERDLLFDYFDANDVFVATILKTIYFTYIRESELSRLQVKDFQMDKNQILIIAKKAKTQKNNLPRLVYMPPKLKAALEIYFKKFESKPDDYIFGKGHCPSEFRLKNNWQRLFRNGLKIVKVKHPNLFLTDKQSPYSMKHTGVTDFVNDNLGHKTSLAILRFVQSQCRHTSLTTTEKYLKKLEITLTIADEFVYD